MVDRWKEYRNSLLATTLLLLVSSSALFAQQGEEPPRFSDLQLRTGIYGSYNQLFHAPDFQALPGVPCCSPGFTDGGGPGLSVGLINQYPILSSLLVDLRAEYRIVGGELSTEEVIGNAVNNGQVVEAVSEHTICPELGMPGIGVGLTWYPIDPPLSLSIGGIYGRLESATYEQVETLVRPESVTYSDGTTERNRSAGNLPTAKESEISAYIGIGYDIDIGSGLTLTPRIEYRRGLTNLIDSTWKVHALQVGAALTFDLLKPGATRRKTPPVADGMATLSAVGVRDGEEVDGVQMSVEEFLENRTVPVLPYVFFSDNSSDIPSRYHRLSDDEMEAFDPNNLHHVGVLDGHHHLLNVIGHRMTNNPGETITLVGCNSGVGAEKGNLGLSEDRAESVRDYLNDVWDIDESRMEIVARDLPETPSNQEVQDGIEENRRVEIISSGSSVLAPVATTDTLRVTNPPSLRFYPGTKTDRAIEDWTIVASQDGRDLKTFSGSGAPPRTVDWEMGGDQRSIPRLEAPLDYQLIVTDSDGDRFASSPSSIAIEQLTVQKKRVDKIDDREFNRYSLILFDFNKSTLGSDNKALIDGIATRVTPGAKVEITGHTDRIGDAAYNQRLSTERAKSVARALNITDRSVTSQVVGRGESPLLYDNTLPEGRFFCRTVNITLETPIAGG